MQKGTLLKRLRQPITAFQENLVKKPGNESTLQKIVLLFSGIFF
jgi:hypothetical protein